MADETPVVPEGPQPRPRRKRKASKPRVRDKAQQRSDALEVASRALRMEEIAIAHLACEYSLEDAATIMGWDLAAVKEVWKRPAVQRYLEKAQEYFLEKLAQTKIRLIKKIKATPAQVEQRLIEIAMMDPSETGGKVEGQVKALGLLAKILDMLKDDDPLKGKSAEELKALISKAHGKIIDGAKVTTQ